MSFLLRRLRPLIFPVFAGALSLCAPLALAGPAGSSTSTFTSGSASTKAAPASTITGKLKREEFEDALKAVMNDLNECYEKALKKDAIAEGDVILSIVTQGGKVIKAETDRDISTMKLEDAHKCIVGVLKKMKMPLAKNAKGEHDPKAIAEIKYPIEFSLGIEVSSGVSQSSGAKIDYDKVKNVFFIEKVQIGRCYLEAYKAKKGVAASGKLVMKMNVVGGKATTVEEVKPDTTLTDAEMKTCIYDAVKKFKFPLAKNPKGVEDDKAVSIVVYPLEFKPK
jgi:hypothetical protein